MPPLKAAWPASKHQCFSTNIDEHATIDKFFAGTESRAIQPSKFFYLAKRFSPHELFVISELFARSSSRLICFQCLLILQAQDYQGGRTASDIVAYAMQLLEANGGPPILIEELVSNQIFDEKCVQRAGICVISFFPHLFDENAAQRNKYLATLSSIAAAKDIKKLPVKFFWAVST